MISMMLQSKRKKVRKEERKVELKLWLKSSQKKEEEEEVDETTAWKGKPSSFFIMKEPETEPAT